MFWRCNADAFAALSRDQAMAAAVARRVDQPAGELMKLVLGMVKSPVSADESSHFYLTDVNSAVASRPGVDVSLKTHRDQYIKVNEQFWLVGRTILYYSIDD